MRQLSKSWSASVDGKKIFGYLLKQIFLQSVYFFIFKYFYLLILSYANHIHCETVDKRERREGEGGVLSSKGNPVQCFPMKTKHILHKRKRLGNLFV